MSTPAITPNQFQYVKLPDGSYGKFAADASDDVIRAAIAKDFPEAFGPSQPQDTRTSLQRFMDSAGIPRHIGTMSDVADAAKNLLSPQASPTSPGFGQTLPVVGPLFRAQRETFDQPGVAAKVYGSIPVLGPIGYRAGQQLESGDYSGAAGSGLNALLQLLGAKGTNLKANASTALDTAGSAIQAAAPAVGKTAAYGADAASVYEAIAKGRYGAALVPFLHDRVGNLAEGAVSRTGQALQATGRAINPAVPDAFGNPAFSAATIPTEAQQQREAFINTLRSRGLALPPGPTELPPSSAVAASPTEGVLPAARQVVRDANTGQLRDQFLTSVADPNQTLSVNQARAISRPYSVDELKFINQVREGLDSQMGVGQEAANQRMAEYAKSPWEKGDYIKVPEKTNSPQVPPDSKSALQQYLENRALLKPQAGNAPITVNPAEPQRSILKQGAPGGNFQKPIPNSVQYAADDQALMNRPEVVNNESNLFDLLSKSLQRAAAMKRRGMVAGD